MSYDYYTDWENGYEEGCKDTENEYFQYVKKLFNALQSIHDECSKTKDGQYLKFGPMFEPSENSVIEIRNILEEFLWVNWKENK